MALAKGQERTIKAISHPTILPIVGVCDGTPMSFGSLKIRLEFLIAPPLASTLRPGIVLSGHASGILHAIDPGRPAEAFARDDLSCRLAAQPALQHDAMLFIRELVRREQRRLVEPVVPGIATLDEQDTRVAFFGKTPR